LNVALHFSSLYSTVARGFLLNRFSLADAVCRNADSLAPLLHVADRLLALTARRPPAPPLEPFDPTETMAPIPAEGLDPRRPELESSPPADVTRPPAAPHAPADAEGHIERGLERKEAAPAVPLEPVIGVPRS